MTLWRQGIPGFLSMNAFWAGLRHAGFILKSLLRWGAESLLQVQIPSFGVHLWPTHHGGTTLCLWALRGLGLQGVWGVGTRTGQDCCGLLAHLKQ